ncbi:CDP-Glycerol:Poly(glycerophosphate) glycerophosphotransferase [Loktanella sp. DSM 29012]|uniref:CDP-glycerol glycerophosphotransferase family protein n=1 Tax=Loktanella sp. DSM 29012 TaxID=1881056 RepID=UPI0008CE3137|nr:CDP-glycerol glycerophosphotransferase family protein [Loktanella sp. DSM 29012]SEQ76633.1 CDP-Glycerol:Poly(glycerophosphate) glycerophosphotransferase [Loktanella sp. DSM 29012]
MRRYLSIMGQLSAVRQLPLFISLLGCLLVLALGLVVPTVTMDADDMLGLVIVLLVQGITLYVPTLLTRSVPVMLWPAGQVPHEIYGRWVGYGCVVLLVLGLLTGWTLWAAIIVVLGFGLYGISARQHYRALHAQTQRALRQIKPDFFVYTGGLAANTYQLTQWLPVLAASRHQFAILCETQDFAAALPPTDLPVLVTRSLRGNEQVTATGASGMLYTGNPQTNTGFLRFAQLQHVFINHGESDKVVNQSKLLQAYDRLFLAGPMAQQRLTDAGIALREGQAVHIGRPPVELDLTRLTDPAGPVRRVLYAPTWEGLVKEADYTSVRAEGFAMLEALLAVPELEVTVKLHPLTGSKSQAQAVWRKRMLALCQQRGVTVHGPDYPIHTAMNDSDLLICDISSVLNDYLYTGKPIVLCHFGEMPVDQVRDEFASAQAAAILTDPAQTAQALSDSTGPQMTAARAAVAEASLSLSGGGMMDRFDAALAQLKQD